MALILYPEFIPPRQYPYQRIRRLIEHLPIQEGVYAAGDLLVSTTGTAMTVNVAAGSAWVLGDTQARQGLYHTENDAAITGVSVPASNATNPRIDQIVLRVYDSSITGASDTPAIEVVQGTATAGATLDNRTGAAALPATAIRLADLLVPAASTVVSTANIRDRRPWARGFVEYALSAAGTFDITGLDGDVDVSYEVDVEGEFANSAAGAFHPRLLLNAANAAYGRNLSHKIQIDNASVVSHATESVAANTGFALCEVAYTTNNAVVATGRLQAVRRTGGNGQRAWVCQWSARRPAGDSSMQGGTMHSALEGGGALHTLRFDAAGKTLTGRIRVRRIFGY